MEKSNKLIVVRGISGSGKSTLAQKLHDADENSVMVAADDFFMVDGEYKFTFSLIQMAHNWCSGTAFYHLLRGKNVYVHNTFCERWQIEPYIDFAHKNGYEWEILEPTTKWRYDVAECAKRNTHGVPEATIQKMFDKWVPTKQLMKDFEKYKND